ncbi:MAG: FUSC family protein, partial [Dokdonella sp.]
VGGGLLVALGTVPGRIGMTSMILLIVTSAEPQPLLGALGVAALISLGGALQTLLALAAWPLQRYRPERHALSTVFRQLAAMTRKQTASDQAPPTTQAIQFAQDLLHGAHRARGTATQSFRILIEISERIRIELLALSDLHEQLRDPQAQRALSNVLKSSGLVLDGIAEALYQATEPLTASALVVALKPLVASLDYLDARKLGSQDARLLRFAHARAQGLAGQLRSAVRNSDFAGSQGEFRAEAAAARLPPSLRPLDPIATLRANLTLSSSALRHSLRCGVCLALAVILERLLKLPHGYWIPMTTAIVLKPDFAGTFGFGLLRVIGTLIGLLLTSVLIQFAFDGLWDRLLLLAVLCFAFRLLVGINYGLGIAALTGLIVILMSFHGEAGEATMAMRGIATIAGSALALAAYALWPTWESANLRPAVADMLDAYRGYFCSLLNEPAERWVDSRTAARTKRTNAQASLDRFSAEPRADRNLVTLAEALFAAGNRLARACMTLEAVLQDAPSLQQREIVKDFSAHIDTALNSIVRSLREGGTPHFPSLRDAEGNVAAELRSVKVSAEEQPLIDAIGHACDRITDSVDALGHLLGRSVGGIDA